MKKILTFALSALALTLSAQVSGRIITDHVKVEDLVWSNLDNEWMFFESIERYPEFNMIETKLNNDLTGNLRITNLRDQEFYDFLVLKTTDGKVELGQMLILDCIEMASGDKCSIVIHKVEKYHMISLMLPNSQMAIFFDNLPE